MGIESRDYYDKGVSFWHEGKYYRWSCSVNNSDKAGPNGEEPLKPSVEKTTRASTIYNCTLIERTDDEKIKIITITQIDFKMKIPPMILNTAMPKSIKGWYDNVVKYYTSNNKKI